MNIANVKAGQRITVKYASPVSWARKTDNPFIGREVTKEATVAFTAAGEDTYSNQLEKRGEEKSGKPSWHAPAPSIGPCVRIHKENGTPYLAGINHDTITSQLYVDGIPASSEQVKEIRSFLRDNREVERGLDFRLWTVDKLANATLD